MALALQTNASALIAAHNHLSGVAEPSDVDCDLTCDLIAACHLLGSKVLEHVIAVETACDFNRRLVGRNLLKQVDLRDVRQCVETHFSYQTVISITDGEASVEGENRDSAG